MSRADSVGLFWEDVPVVLKRGVAHAPRTLPAVPDTGWRMPTELPRLDGARRIAIDVETKDEDLLTLGPGVRRGGEIVGLAVGTDDARWYFPMRHTMGENMEPAAVMAWARDALGNAAQPKVGANLLYDVDYLAEAGVDVRGELLDVQTAEPLIDENAYTYALDSIAHKYLREGKRDEVLYDWCSRAFGGLATREQARNIWRTPASLVGPYAEADVTLPLQVLDKQMEVLQREDLVDLFALECSLIPMLLAMRRRGVRIDATRADEVYGMLDREASVLQDMVGCSVTSPAELALLCDREGIAYTHTATGRPSFTADWLKMQSHPKLEAALELRKLYKTRDTFVKGYLQKYNVEGRLHCLFHALRSDKNGTVSGRFSSSNPNLQNIPNRDERIGPMIRALFLPEEEEDWARLDWSQIEFRLLVHYGRGSGSAETRAAYVADRGLDFHKWVSEITGVDRKPAKNINFGLVYGMGEPTLAAHLGKSLEEVRPIFTQYHSRLPFVRDTFGQASAIAATRGYIKTMLGRRRRFECDEKGRRIGTHRALNALLQGSAADLMKKAMVTIWESGVCDVLGAPLLTVHDELDWSVPRTTAGREAIEAVQHIMEHCAELRVPIFAEIERGTNWGNCK